METRTDQIPYATVLTREHIATPTMDQIAATMEKIVATLEKIAQPRFSTSDLSHFSTKDDPEFDPVDDPEDNSFESWNRADVFVHGATEETLLVNAARGYFIDVTRLMEFQLESNTSFPIPRIYMDVLWNSTCEKLQRKLIHWVAHYGKKKILKWMLNPSVEQENRNILEFGDQTPKFYTISPYARLECLNAQDKYGFTPLHLAVEANHEDFVKALLVLSDHQVDICIAAQFMPILEERKRRTNGLTPLHIAARNGSLGIVKMFLGGSTIK